VKKSGEEEDVENGESENKNTRFFKPTKMKSHFRVKDPLGPVKWRNIGDLPAKPMVKGRKPSSLGN